MEIKINEKKVVINSVDNWTYDGINMAQLKELNEKLFNEVNKQIIYYVENKEKIDKEKAEKEKAEKIANNKIKLEEFKKFLNDNHSELLEDYDITFSNPEHKYNYCNFKEKYFKIVGFKISYSDRVYRYGDWSPSRTNKVWEVKDPDYKTRRYSKLETAIEKTIVRIKEHIKEKEIENKIENRKINAENEMQKFAESHGFKYEKNYHSYKHRRYNRTYYVYNMIKKNIIATIEYDESVKKVKILSYKISHDNITIEELKAIKI